MVKISIIIDNISNGAGTEKAIVNLYNGLLKFYPNFYELTIISLFSKKHENSFFDINKNIKIIHLEKTKTTYKNKVFWYLGLIKEMKAINKIEGFDVLIGTTYIHNILLPFFIKKSKTKTIGCEHVVYDYPPKFYKIIRRLIYPKIDLIVVLNETEKDNFSFLKNIAVIPNFLSYKSKETASLINKKIISVGRITYEKGFDMLIDIYKNIYNKIQDWELNIFGEGEDLEKLNNKVKELGLEKNIKFCGVRKNISDNYLESSIFAICSRTESFGIVLLEAMNFGLPVISFDCDGPKNLIENNYNGYLIPKFDIEKFSSNLLLLIENFEKRKEIGANAKQVSLKYNEEKIIPFWNEKIQLLINSGKT